MILVFNNYIFLLYIIKYKKLFKIKLAILTKLK